MTEESPLCGRGGRRHIVQLINLNPIKNKNSLNKLLIVHFHLNFPRIMSSKRKSPPTKLDGACGVSPMDGSVQNGQQQVTPELDEQLELECATASPLFNEPIMDGQSYHNNYQFDTERERERERQPASKKKRNNQVKVHIFVKVN